MDELLKSHAAPESSEYDSDDPSELAVLERSAFTREALGVPAVLAAAGRLVESRQALTEYLRSDRAYVRSAEYRRYAQRLTGWLDAGGQLPSAPS